MNDTRQEKTDADVQRLAEIIKAACVRAALDGYERAGLSGMCEEGRWEMAVDAIRSLDVEDLLNQATPTEARPHV